MTVMLTYVHNLTWHFEKALVRHISTPVSTPVGEKRGVQTVTPSAQKNNMAPTAEKGYKQSLDRHLDFGRRRSNEMENSKFVCLLRKAAFSIYYSYMTAVCY